MFDVDSVDKDATKDGVWTEFNGGKFLIAHTSNLGFQREFSRLQQPYAKQIERGRMDPEVSLNIMCKAMSKHILLGWEGVGSSGRELPYSDSTAYTVLKNNPELREFVQNFALDIDGFKREVEEAEGNS